MVLRFLSCKLSTEEKIYAVIWQCEYELQVYKINEIKQRLVKV